MEAAGGQEGQLGHRHETFKEFPPSQKPGSFSIDDALQSLLNAPKATGD
jgi:hypothetical protein